MSDPENFIARWSRKKAAAVELVLRDRSPERVRLDHDRQPQLAPLVGYSRSTVANAETGRRTAARDFWHCCDEVLATTGALTRQYDELDALTG